MTYSEADDIAGHAADVRLMDARLLAAGRSPDWPTAFVLDVGGAGGLHAALLAPRCRRLYFNDLIDCNLQYGGEYVKLLSEKCVRHDLQFPMEKIEFHAMDAMDMAYRDGLFNFVCSFNTFEHIPDPTRALSEMARVTRSGGFVYLSFDPLWTADSGSHFAHFHLDEPWAHLVNDAARYEELLRASGAGEADVREARTAMNRIRLADFTELFKKRSKSLGLTLRHHESWEGFQFQDAQSHPNYRAALAMGYSAGELATRGISVVFEKR